MEHNGRGDGVDGVRALSLQLHRVPYDDAEVRALVDQVQQEYVRRYGGPDVTVMRAAEFAPPGGTFLLGRVDGQAVAVGGWRAREPAQDPGLRPGDAELKRMYVRPEWQRRGFARTMLAELERTAHAAGRTRMVLETGTAQPEAIALYTAAGYVQIPGFGRYRDESDAHHYAKLLG